MKSLVIKLTKKPIYFILRSLCRFFFNVKVHGQTSPGSKTVYVCNHISLLDGLIVSLFLPQVPYVVMTKTRTVKVPFSMSLDYLLYVSLKIIMNYSNVIAIDPSSPHSMKTIINVINEGKPLLIFPEGKITTDGELGEIQDGIGFMISKTGAKVISLHIEGLQRSYFSYMKDESKLVFTKVDLYVMDSLTFDIEKIKQTRNRKEVIEYIMASIEEQMEDNKFTVDNINRT